MQKKLLLVIDYQKDFVDGALGFPGAEKLAAPIAARIDAYHALGEAGQVIFTMDTHGANYMETEEGKHLPVPHCIEGTPGWQLFGPVAERKRPEDLSFCKPTFGSLELAEYLAARAELYESVEFVGLVSNICVISNIALVKAAMPQVPQIVDATLVGSGDPALHEAALQVMAGIHVTVER